MRPNRWWIIVALGVLALWAGTDLYGPRQIDIREFDPVVVARLDTEM